jgi:glutamyl/glutaminyl-tRNA synthetase
VQKPGGKRDRDRLDWFNGVWIRRLMVEELERRLEPFIPREWDRALLRRALPFAQTRAKTLVEIRDQLEFLFDEVRYDADLLVPKGRDRAGAADALDRAARVLRDLRSFDHTEIEPALRRTNDELGWKMREASHPVRVAVTGRDAGPPLFDALELLGKERTLARIEHARSMLNGGS